MISTQFNAKIKILWSDNGTKYIDGEFRSYFNENGILYQTTYIRTPKQNGVAEQKIVNFLRLLAH